MSPVTETSQLGKEYFCLSLFKRKMPNFIAANFSNWAQNQVFSHAYIVNGFKKNIKLVK